MSAEISLAGSRKQKTATWISAFGLLFVALSYSSQAGELVEKYSCERGYFLDRYVSNDGVQDVHWSHDIGVISGQEMRAGGGFMQGHKIRLGDLALWLDRYPSPARTGS